MPTLTATSASFGASSVSTHTFTAGADTGGAPAAPTGLHAAGGIAQVVLTWTASIGASTYGVFRGTTPGGESGTAIATGIATTTYTDTTRPAGTTYYYTVKAVNASGTSPASGEATATTTPQILTASVSPSLKPGDTNKTVTLTDNGYATWTSGTPGSPTFAVSKAPTDDVTKNSQAVASATSATVNVDAGATSGTITFDAGGGQTATIGVGIGRLRIGGVSIGRNLSVGSGISL